jgi:hypothetical protein
MRSFDPRAVGALECRAWETYYRRKWLAFLVASVGLVKQAFRMSWVGGAAAYCSSVTSSPQVTGLPDSSF